ncbi:MAG: hypothetical protein INR65_19665 [Gluconacetobacter diazotrophicus]|nr:hypothetical protein [Gluconacetobacter diazotrophicus]
MTIIAEVSFFWRATSVVGLGFFPLFEGNVAVPAALALGMSPWLAVVLSVLGTTVQTLLVRALAGRLLAFPRVAAWWERRLAGRVGRLFTWRGVTWVVLVGIPWLGGLPTALGARLAGMSTGRYVGWAVSGLVLHAGVLALLIRLGLRALGKH